MTKLEIKNILDNYKGKHQKKIKQLYLYVPDYTITYHFGWASYWAKAILKVMETKKEFDEIFEILETLLP